MAVAHTKQNLRYLATIHTQHGIARKVWHGLSQPSISKIFHGKQHLTPAQAQAIELSCGIPNGWLRKYPLDKMFGLLREIKALCPGERKLRVIHRLLGIALENAPSKEQTR